MASSITVSWMAVDSYLMCVDRDKVMVPSEMMLADAVAELGWESSTSKYELFAAKREGSWLSLSDAITFGRRKPEELALYMTASSALKMNQPVSVFQYTPPASCAVHLIIKEIADSEPATKKQKTPQPSLHELAERLKPSSFARASGDNGWVLQLKNYPGQIDCHRVRSDPVPLVFLHEVFANFHDGCKEDNFGDEKSFAEAARNLISAYLGYLVEVKTDHNCETDGSIVHNGRLLLNLECKVERGSGGGDPAMQNIAYYLKHIPSRIDRRFPCFLLDLCGPFMTLFGMCNTSTTHAVCEPLTHAFPLFYCSNDLLMVPLVRTWASLKRCVAALFQEDTTAHVTPGSIEFPYKRACKLATGDRVRVPVFLSYTRRVTRHVFEARHPFDPSHSLHPDGLVIVKFAKRYSTKVHDFCHAQGFAPKLLYHETIAGGWIFLVMEKGEGLVNVWSSPDKIEAKMQLESLAEGLKAQGLVHGDLRETNVMWNSTQRRIVVWDFDWSGEEGKVRYPPFMNPAILWPPGASTGELITSDHDRYFIKER